MFGIAEKGDWFSSFCRHVDGRETERVEPNRSKMERDLSRALGVRLKRKCISDRVSWYECKKIFLGEILEDGRCELTRDTLAMSKEGFKFWRKNHYVERKGRGRKPSERTLRRRFIGEYGGVLGMLIPRKGILSDMFFSE